MRPRPAATGTSVPPAVAAAQDHAQARVRGYGHQPRAAGATPCFDRSVTCQETTGQTPAKRAPAEASRLAPAAGGLLWRSRWWTWRLWSVRYAPRVSEPGVSKTSDPSRVTHGRDGHWAGWCRLNDAPGRAAEADSGEPAQRGLDAGEERPQEEPSPRRRRQWPRRDVTVEHIELHDTNVVVQNSRVAEKHCTQTARGRAGRPGQLPSTCRSCNTPRDRAHPGGNAGWPPGRRPPPRNDEWLRAPDGKLTRRG